MRVRDRSVFALATQRMSNATFNKLWQEAMLKLNEQCHLEDHTLGVSEEDQADMEQVRPDAQQ